MPSSFIEIDTKTGKPVVIGNRVATLPVQPAGAGQATVLDSPRNTGLILLGLSLSGALLMWRGKHAAPRPPVQG